MLKLSSVVLDFSSTKIKDRILSAGNNALIWFENAKSIKSKSRYSSGFLLFIDTDWTFLEPIHRRLEKIGRNNNRKLMWHKIQFFIKP